MKPIEPAEMFGEFAVAPRAIAGRGLKLKVLLASGFTAASPREQSRGAD